MPSGATLLVIYPQDTPNTGRYKINYNFSILAFSSFTGISASKFTNPNPTTRTVGGIQSGSTFAGDYYLQDMMDLLLYPATTPNFTSFLITSQATSLEVGEAVAGIKTFTWNIANWADLQPNSIDIEDTTNSTIIATNLADDGTETVFLSSVSRTTPGANIWTISAQDTDLVTFSREYQINWYYASFYGISVSTTLNAAGIVALTGTSLVSDIDGSYPLAGSGYGYICVPDTFSTPNGFRDSITNLPVEMAGTSEGYNYFDGAFYYDSVSVTRNAIPITYRVYRTRNTITSSTIAVSLTGGTVATLQSVINAGNIANGSAAILGNFSATTFFSGSSELSSLFGPSTFVAPGVNAYTGGTPSRPIVGVIGSPVFTAVTASSISGTSISATTLFSGNTNIGNLFGPSTFVAPGVNAYTGGTATRPIVGVIGSPVFTAVTASSISGTSISATTIFSGSTDLSQLIGSSTLVQPGTNISTGGTPSRPIVGVIGSPVFTAVTASSISGTSISATTFFSGSTDLGQILVAPDLNTVLNVGNTGQTSIILQGDGDAFDLVRKVIFRDTGTSYSGSPDSYIGLDYNLTIDPSLVLYSPFTEYHISDNQISDSSSFPLLNEHYQFRPKLDILSTPVSIGWLSANTGNDRVISYVKLGDADYGPNTGGTVTLISSGAPGNFMVNLPSRSGTLALEDSFTTPNLYNVLNVGNTGETSIILQGDGIIGDVFPFDLVRKVIFRETNPALSGSSDPSIGIDYNVGLIGSLFLESPFGIYHQAKIGPFDISLFPISLSPHHQFVGGAGTTGVINLGWLSANTGNEHVFRYIQLGSLNTTSSIGGDILLIASGLTGNRIINFPDRSGIVALEDGIVSNLDDVLNSGNTAYSKNMILSGSSAVFSGGSIFAGVDIEVDTVFDPLNPYNILGASIIGGTSPSLSANTNNSVILGGSNNRIFDSPTSSVLGGTNSYVFQLQNSTIINSVDSSVSGFGYTFYNDVPRTIIGSINSNINDDGAWFGSYNELVEISNSKNSSISSSSSSSIRSSLDSLIQIGSTYSDILNSNTVQLQGSYLNVLGSLSVQISGSHSSVMNSINSLVTGHRSFDIGGHTNLVYTNRSIALGTTGTTFSSDGSVAIGGVGHTFPSIGGSNLNPSYSVILGGRNSTMSHSGSTILGGFGITSEAHNTVFMPNAKSLGGMSAATFYSGTTDLSDLFGSGALSTYVQPGVNISTGGTPSRPVVNVIGSPVFTAVTASFISGTSVSATTFFSGTSDLSSLIGAPTYVAPGVNAYTGGTPSRPIVGVIGSPVFTAVTASSVSGTSISATTFFSGSTNLDNLFGPSTFVAPGVNAYTGGTPSRPIVGVVGSPVFTAVTASSVSGTSVSATTIFSGSTNIGSLFGPSTFVAPGVNAYTGGTPSRPIVGVTGSPVFTAVTASSISGTSISGGTFYSGATSFNDILSSLSIDTSRTYKSNVRQASHGLSIGSLVYIRTNGEHTIANSFTLEESKVVGMVTDVIDADAFELTTEGYCDLSLLTTILPTLSPGVTYYLTKTPGVLGTSPPTDGGLIKPVFVGIDASAFYLWNGTAEMSPTGFRISTGDTSSIRTLLGLATDSDVTFNSLIATSSVIAASVSATTIFSGSTNLGSLFGPSTFVAPGVNAYTGGTPSRPIVGVIGSPVFTAVTASSVSGTSVSATTFFSGSTDLSTFFAQGGGSPTYVKPGVNISTGGTPSAPVINVVGSPVFTAVTATDISGTSVSATTFYSGSTNLGSLIGQPTFVKPGLNITTGGTANSPTVGTLGTVVFTGITFTSTLIDQSSNASTGVYFKATGTGLLTTSNRFTYDTSNGLVRLTLGADSGVYTSGGFTADTFVQAANFISGSTNLNNLFGPSTFVAPGVNAYTGGTPSRPIVGVIGSPVFTAVTASSLSGTSISGATLFSGSSNLGTLFASTTHTHTASQISDSSDVGKNLLTASTVTSQLGFLGITELALSSNYSNSGTGAENVTELAFSATAGRTYLVAMAGTWRGNNATNNPRFGFTFSTGTGTISFMGQRMTTTAPTYNQMGASAANTASAGGAATITANADLSFQFQASISATTTGVVSFFIQVPANTTTIKTPTSMVIYEAG